MISRTLRDIGMLNDLRSDDISGMGDKAGTSDTDIETGALLNGEPPGRRLEWRAMDHLEMLINSSLAAFAEFRAGAGHGGQDH